MKALRVVSTIVGLLALIYYGYQFFGSPNGKKYEIDKNHHVFYKGDGVTKDDAKKTGDFLKEIGLVDESKGMDVQIKADKPTDDVKFSLVFDKSKVTPEVESSALAIGAQLSTSVFNGRKIMVVLADDNLDEIKNLGYATAAQTQTQPNDVQQTDDNK